MKRVVIVGIGVAVATACGEITPPEVSPAPMNHCGQQSDCERFQLPGATCTKDGICVVPGKLSFTLAVSMPTTSFHAPGETIFLPPQYLNDLFAKQSVPSSCADQDTRPVCKCRRPTCLFLPSNGESQGALHVGRDVAKEVWPGAGCGSSSLSQADRDQYCGLRPKDPNTQYTTLPTRVVFRPLWPVGTSFSFMKSIGITLQPDITATILDRTDEPLGPNKTIGTRYDVLLQAGSMDSGVGWYVLRMDPVPPFDSAFPPIVTKVQVAGTQGSTEYRPFPMDGFDVNPMARTFTLSTKGPNLTGWRVYLAAKSAATKKGYDMPVRDGERLSTVRTLSNAAGETVLLQTALGVNTLHGMRLVIEPPPNQALPTFAIEDFEGVVPTMDEIPALPTAVDVNGTVTLDGKGRPARVAFESLRGPDGAIELTDGTFSAVLSYRTMVETDASGAYRVLLPPGKYGVYVEPLVADAAKTVIPFVVGSKDLVQQGRALELKRKTHVRGTVALGDGRMVGDAEIDFMPALQQPMGTNPLALPRPARGRTVISNGVAAFDLDLDPGVYDITVAPLAGTRFPWIVQTARSIQQLPNVMLDPFIVPPPIQQGNVDAGMFVVPGLTIRDPYGTAVVGALVDVYAASELSPGAPLYLVGRTQTDANGHFDLHLAGAPK